MIDQKERREENIYLLFFLTFSFSLHLLDFISIPDYNFTTKSKKYMNLKGKRFKIIGWKTPIEKHSDLKFIFLLKPIGERARPAVHYGVCSNTQS